MNQSNEPDLPTIVGQSGEDTLQALKRQVHEMSCELHGFRQSYVLFQDDVLKRLEDLEEKTDWSARK